MRALWYSRKHWVVSVGLCNYELSLSRRARLGCCTLRGHRRTKQAIAAPRLDHGSSTLTDGGPVVARPCLPDSGLIRTTDAAAPRALRVRRVTRRVRSGYRSVTNDGRDLRDISIALIASMAEPVFSGPFVFRILPLQRKMDLPRSRAPQLFFLPLSQATLRFLGPVTMGSAAGNAQLTHAVRRTLMYSAFGLKCVVSPSTFPLSSSPPWPQRVPNHCTAPPSHTWRGSHAGALAPDRPAFVLSEGKPPIGRKESGGAPNRQCLLAASAV
ncbi:hypothetical protein HPB50_024945 [Hyalomma asiaticum]|uniref:Uncharacterized protein n=1 Tax=Hyalomma asiaticum TaxID=266040 RepID=A0ACB7TN76_HYAAI|nr:hypothetical protein HPB50_024945 [Hyalomma asiaticum]